MVYRIGYKYHIDTPDNGSAQTDATTYSITPVRDLSECLVHRKNPTVCEAQRLRNLTLQSPVSSYGYTWNV